MRELRAKTQPAMKRYTLTQILQDFNNSRFYPCQIGVFRRYS